MYNAAVRRAAPCALSSARNRMCVRGGAVRNRIRGAIEGTKERRSNGRVDSRLGASAATGREGVPESAPARKSNEKIEAI